MAHRLEAGRFCGRACSGASQQKQKADRQARLEAEKASRPPAPTYGRACQHCSAAFVSSTDTARYCSRACRIRAKRARAHSTDYMREYMRAYTRKRAGLVSRTIECRECGSAFEAARKKAYCCSPECSKRFSRRCRDYAKRTTALPFEKLSPRSVFERDGWTCQECGVPTPEAKRGTTEPNSPELDHILPLSRGGTHTYANVQCLCRQCNMRKGARMPEAA